MLIHTLKRNTLAYDYFISSLLVNRVIGSSEHDVLRGQFREEFRNNMLIHVLLVQINDEAENSRQRILEAFQYNLYYNILSKKWSELSKNIHFNH